MVPEKMYVTACHAVFRKCHSLNIRRKIIGIVTVYVTVCHAPDEYTEFGFFSNHVQYLGSRQ